MNSNTIEIDGYTVTVVQDESPENPFTAWDCEPPLLVYSLGHRGNLTSYNGAPESIADFARLLPDSFFARGSRVALIREYLPDVSLRDFAERKSEWGYTDKETCVEIFSEEYSRPSGWRSACEWFELAKSLLTKAGIPCHHTQSNGYSQGDSVLLLAIALPEWCKTTGVDPANGKEVCESACELYGAWAWGDVYGIAEITDPEGCELRDGRVWGFYGSDHEKSGLLESARESINYHKRKAADALAAHDKWLKNESAESFRAACADIITV